MSEDRGEWQIARKRKGQTRKTKLQVSINTSSNQEHLNVDKTVKRLKQTVSDLRCEIFYTKWKEELLKCPQMSADQKQCVCYGLGSFSSCVSARYQLAMLLLLLEAVKIELKHCFVYDPAFSSGEKDVLGELGLTVLTENEEGKRLTEKPSLFYLMHCGKALYNNLLWKNWSKHCLSEMIIVGNSFCGMRDRSIDREFKRDYSFISLAADVCEERMLPCPSHMIDVFGDTAVITFPPNGLNKLTQSTWENHPEPQYEQCQDLEIVLRDR